MRQFRAGLVLLTVQLLLVLSIAGKYLYERRTCPRVWSRATQVDPDSALRGRYLALQLLVDACGLPRDTARYEEGFQDFTGKSTPGSWNWDVSIQQESGHLVPRLEVHPEEPGKVYRLSLRSDKTCDRVPLLVQQDYFIPEHTKWPQKEKQEDELWVEVTLPPSGPPRPIQLALSDGATFRPLRLR